jgi:phosphohistidine phosphatase
MDLIIWRHAEAQGDAPGGNDLQRALTPRGEKQAARVAPWLDRHLPDGVRVLCSPALRCEQTVQPLGRKYKISDALAPGGSPAGILEAVEWPQAKQAVLIVGHQPVLGDTVAQLLQMKQTCTIRKGAVWWLRTRQRNGGEETIVVAVQSADSL